ncbi:PaaI family thioesterase [Ornithinimicrobium faecis]|uniref:PaaI family thioesterase n=1 Tax=Ornithinimicrobium faecis TaxID=2934158 RepID=UPI002118EF37|nr:PaaI family thioesterase [Ornithinimicrobium sp. HY1745]
METPSVMPQESSFSRHLGIEEIAVDPSCASYRMAISPELSNRNGVLHGGALMSLVDHCGGSVGFANCPPGKTTVTLESKTNFFRAARVGDTVTAEGTPLHAGRTSVVVQVITRRGDGKEVSATTQTQLFLEWQD